MLSSIFRHIRSASIPLHSEVVNYERIPVCAQRPVEEVLQAVEVMRVKEDGAPVKPATVNTYVVSATRLRPPHRFNAAPLIKLKKAPRQVAQRILGELEVRKMIDAAKPGRDRLMLAFR